MDPTFIFEKCIDLVPLKDIKESLNIEDGITAEIFGNYNTFIYDQTNKNGFLYKLLKFISTYKLSEEEKESYNWLIICKKGYIKYIKDCFEYFMNYFSKRSDLNFFTRLKLSVLKTKHWVGRAKFVADIYDFKLSKEKYNKKIKELFDNKEIDRIYIYKYTKRKLWSEALFDVKYRK